MIRKLRNSLLALATTALFGAALMLSLPALRQAATDDGITAVAGTQVDPSAKAGPAAAAPGGELRRGARRHGRSSMALPYFSFAARSLTP